MFEADFLYELGQLDGPASCLDCRHWCVCEGCALAGNSAVDAFTDPYNSPQDADMSHCPGFEEYQP
jgi:hypothetical protein